MYYDVENYISDINEYRIEFSYFMEQQKAILLYWTDQVKEDFSSKPININDYFDYGNHPGASKAAVMSSLSNAFIIMTLGRFEYHLVVLCDVVRRALGIGLSHNSITGNGIRKILNYLEPLLGFDFQRGNNEIYDTLMSWNSVRNKLTHNDGIAGTDSDFNRIFKTGVSLDYNAIVTDMDDCIRLYDVLQEFSNKLFDELLKVA